MDIELATRYQPYFYFHREETDMPVDYEVLIAESQLMDYDQVVMQREENQSYKDYINQVVEFSKKNPLCILNVPPSLWRGTPNPPLYASFRETDDMYIINYTLIFGYNRTKRNFFPGSHMVDIEHVTVRISKTTNELLDMYHAAHWSYDSMWRKRDKIEMINGRPVIYCAKFSHAMYPTACRLVDAYGEIIDGCAKDRLLVPHLEIITRDRPKWLEYDGQDSFGNEHYLTQDETKPFRRYYMLKNSNGPSPC